jgi:hypothetical protein
MTSSLDQEVLEYLTRYLVGDLTVADFHRWFMPRVWELPQADPGSHRFSRRVAVRLAEFTSDHCSEPELRDALLELLPDSITVSTSRSSVDHWNGPRWIAWSQSRTASDGDLVPA